MLQPRTRPPHLTLPPALRRAALAGDWARMPRLTPREGWRQALWQAVWSPWWLGSEMPPPPLPRQTHPTTPTTEPARYVAHSLDVLARRYHGGWALLLAVRGLWLGLMVAAIWLVLGILDQTVTPGLRAVLALAAVGCALGVVLGCFVRPDRRRLARMLDRSYGLQERMTTAVDLLTESSTPGRQGLDAVQLADAGNQLITLQLPRRLTTLLPVREVMLLLLWTMLLLALAFAGLDAIGIPAPSRAAIPAYVPASQRLAAPDEAAPVEAMPSVAEIQERSRQSNDARRNLDVLGEALGEHPSTMPAADAIAAADYPGAAEALRSAASASSTLSPQAREALADDLDTAAGQMSEGSPELAESTRQAADGLRQGGDQGEEGLGGLADQVEETGQQIVPQQELAEQQAAAAEGSAAEQPAGQSASSGEAGEGAQQQPGGEAGEGETGGDPNAGQDPGSGVDARSGATNGEQEQSNQSGQSGGEQDGGSGENQAGSEGAAGSEGQPGQPGQPGQEGQQGQSGGEPAEGQGSGEESGDAPSGSQSDQTGSGDTSQSGQGSGAGSGQANPDNPATTEGSQSTGQEGPQNRPEEEATGGSGPAAQPPPESAGGATTQPTVVAGAGDEAVSLSGQSDEGVQTGGNAGSASLGSGSGAGAGGGDVVQGAVGEAGPDSNRVPADYRDVVSSYFEEEQP